MHEIVKKAVEQLSKTLYGLPGHAEARVTEEQDRLHTHGLILAIGGEARGASLDPSQC